VFNTRVNVYFRATVSAVSCLVVPAFICVDLPYSCALKLNDDDDDDDDDDDNVFLRDTGICIFFKMATSGHVGVDPTGNGAVRSTIPETKHNKGGRITRCGVIGTVFVLIK